MKLAVIDAGPLGQMARDQILRSRLEVLVRQGFDVIVPNPILAEALTGTARDAPVHWTLRRLGTVPTPRATAELAGRLRHHAWSDHTRPSGIDAIVAAHAVAEGEAAVIVTTDGDDMAALVAPYPRIQVLVV